MEVEQRRRDKKGKETERERLAAPCMGSRLGLRDPGPPPTASRALHTYTFSSARSLVFSVRKRKRGMAFLLSREHQ